MFGDLMSTCLAHILHAKMGDASRRLRRVPWFPGWWAIGGDSVEFEVEYCTA